MRSLDTSDAQCAAGRAGDGPRDLHPGAGQRPAPFPLLTLGLAALALGLHLLPGAREGLAFDRLAFEAGEPWRLLTGHWVHWSADHLLWDVGTFVALGIACERRSRARLAACLAASVLGIGALVAWGLTDLSHYGGLSGVDCALFALLVSELWREQWQGASRAAPALALGLALALALKVGFEWASGQAFFVANLGPGVVPVPAAHVAGAVVGAVIPLLSAGAPAPMERT
jgi:rhomboid family GlyGly-CTERM serine protease